MTVRLLALRAGRALLLAVQCLQNYATLCALNYHSSGHYSSLICYLKARRFVDWIISSIGGAFSDGPNIQNRFSETS
jgi:hypothetical protein